MQRSVASHYELSVYPKAKAVCLHHCWFYFDWRHTGTTNRMSIVSEARDENIPSFDAMVAKSTRIRLIKIRGI